MLDPENILHAHHSAGKVYSHVLIVISSRITKAEPILQLKDTMRDNGDVLRLENIQLADIEELLLHYGLTLKVVPIGVDIPGSYWGDDEAGLIGEQLMVRTDTPLHSILHEACHYVCMDRTRRGALNTDAGGDYDEENAVCYLQVLLADRVRQFDRQRMFTDMDRWGYTFRLGSAQVWFESDADDAQAYLLNLGLIDQQNQPTFKLRKE